MKDDNRYVIVKMREWSTPIVQKSYGTMTLEEARKICSDSSIKGGKFPNRWFLGFTKA